MLAEASVRFDWVIIDAPPIGLIADASLLAPLSDGVLLVVRASGAPTTPRRRRPWRRLAANAVLGVVLNDVEVEDVARVSALLPR